MLTRTTTALLEGLLDPADHETWLAFDGRYRPVLIAFARRLGLSPEDAADAAQETLARFVKSFRGGKYDRDRGRLSSWIIGIARHSVYDLLQQRAGSPERGMSAIAELPDDSHLTRVWDEECRLAILRDGLDELRRETRTSGGTLRAFEMLALERCRPAEVAERLGMTLNDVYLAKHRCLKRLRDLLAPIEAAYEIS